MREKHTNCQPLSFATVTDVNCSHLPGHVSGEVAVGSELEVATISCGVVHHINLSRLEVEKQVHIETETTLEI